MVLDPEAAAGLGGEGGCLVVALPVPEFLRKPADSHSDKWGEPSSLLHYVSQSREGSRWGCDPR